MEYFVIKDLISDKISGEWGVDPVSDKRVKVIRTTNFTNEGKINFSNVVAREIPESKVKQKHLINGDVIIEKSGGSPSQPVGRVVFFDVSDKSTYLCNNFTSILRPSEKVFPKYLFYNLFYLHLKNKTLNYQNKTTGIINLQLDRYIETEKIPVPPLEDQKRIVKTLDEIENIRQKRKHTRDLLNEYIKSVFLELFSDPVTNPKDWNKEELKSFGKIITGNTPSRNKEDNYSSRFIEWVKTDNIVEDELYLTKADEYLSETGLNKARFVNPGAVLMACIAGSIASIGRVGIADRKLSFNQQINAIQPNERVNPFFLYWLLRISRLYIQNHATKGMKKIITKGEFEKMVMIFPPIKLQNEFAKIVFNTESVKQKMLFQSKELDTQFQALLQKAFRGEL